MADKDPRANFNWIAPAQQQLRGWKKKRKKTEQKKQEVIIKFTLPPTTLFLPSTSPSLRYSFRVSLSSAKRKQKSEKGEKRPEAFYQDSLSCLSVFAGESLSHVWGGKKGRISKLNFPVSISAFHSRFKQQEQQRPYTTRPVVLVASPETYIPYIY